MSNDDICFLPITKLSALLRLKDLSPVELTSSCLNRIEKLNPSLNAFISVLKKEAMENAILAEKEIANGNYRGLLHGIPVAVKDLFASQGVRSTSGSRILKDYIPNYDATALARLNNSGAILLGKLQLSEFAGGDDINPLTGSGPAKNPWNMRCSAGSSSSGSGVSVAASLCAASLGTDTGGSIREPAAFNGIVGMKPTFGRVSRFGVTPLSYSLDTVGPMTKTVEDNAIMLEAIAGYDAKDSWSSSQVVTSYRKHIRDGVRGLRVGLPKKFFFDYATKELGDAVFKAAQELERQGAILSEVELPHLKYTIGVEFAILLSEALAYHMQYLNQGKESEYTRTFLYGVLEPAKSIRGADYMQAQRIRNFVIRDFEEAYAKVDVILAPGAGAAATPLDEEDFAQYETPLGMQDLIEMWPRIYFPASLSCVPSLVMPCGFSKAGLPLSLAVMGKHFDEATVYRVAYAYEQLTSWHRYKPNV